MSIWHSTICSLLLSLCVNRSPYFVFCMIILCQRGKQYYSTITNTKKQGLNALTEGYGKQCQTLYSHRRLTQTSLLSLSSCACKEQQLICTHLWSVQRPFQILALQHTHGHRLYLLMSERNRLHIQSQAAIYKSVTEVTQITKGCTFECLILFQLVYCWKNNSSLY